LIAHLANGWWAELDLGRPFRALVKYLRRAEPSCLEELSSPKVAHTIIGHHNLRSDWNGGKCRRVDRSGSTTTLEFRSTKRWSPVVYKIDSCCGSPTAVKVHVQMLNVCNSCVKIANDRSSRLVHTTLHEVVSTACHRRCNLQYRCSMVYTQASCVASLHWTAWSSRVCRKMRI